MIEFVMTVLKKSVVTLLLCTIFVFGQKTASSAMTRIAGMSKISDSYRFAFVVEYKRYKDAKGIAAFPNGGVPKVYVHRFVFYDADARTKKVVRRLRIDDPWKEMLVRYVTLGALEKEGTLYAEIYGIVGNKRVYRYIKIDKTGKYQTIDRAQMHWTMAQEVMFRKQGETHFLRLGTTVHPPAVTAWMDDTMPYAPERFKPLFVFDETTGELVQ